MEKILVYLGPSLPIAKARKILPDAIYRPPAKQGDIVTDCVNYQPNRIILIDGVFRENLSPWHKEIIYGLQYPSVKAIYGAASMGALRAAELEFVGMVGIGKIFEWYRDGVTEDDSEVALSYAQREGPEGPLYYPNTIPLVDIRAGVEHYQKEFPGEQVAGFALEFFKAAQGVFYMDRTRERCEQLWADALGITFPHIAQKQIDAIEALSDFLKHEPKPEVRPTPENLSGYFHALYERDRRIKVNGSEIPQQHIDAHVLLHNPEWERICWDSANQELALLLCDQLRVTVDLPEIQKESRRFQKSAGVETPEDFHAFLENNGWTTGEYDRLMIQNARIRKLQHHHTVTKMYRRNTQAIIDYLRTHGAFDYWAIQAAGLEERIKRKGADDWLTINLEKSALALLLEHFEKEGLELKSSPEEYLLDTGFSNMTELSVALQRTAAGKEQ